MNHNPRKLQNVFYKNTVTYCQYSQNYITVDTVSVFPTVDSAWLTSIGNFQCAVWLSNNSATVGWLNNGEGQESWYILGVENKCTDHNINCTSTTTLTSKHTIMHCQSVNKAYIRVICKDS